jgi:23S rRNA pseudouridine1911/1915/1917 synthase
MNLMKYSSDDNNTFFISEDEAGERLDKILTKRFSKLGSRTYFQFLIEEGNVLVDGETIKKRVKPKVGAEVEVEFTLTPDLELEAENIPLDIIYEDESLLVVNKPAGMVVHPATGNWTGTFVNALLYHCCSAFTDIERTSSERRPGIVHRLDKETSGLLVAAKTMQTQQRLIEMFAGRLIYKEYLAVCVGSPGAGKIDLPIGRHPVHRKMMAVLPDKGRAALTHYTTLAYDESLSVVRLVIATGRTHQIRVHMKHRGMPVLGDSVYGLERVNAKYDIDRQLLHAHRLRFEHPLTGTPLELEAPIPADMQRIIDKINRPRRGP